MFYYLNASDEDEQIRAAGKKTTGTLGLHLPVCQKDSVWLRRGPAFGPSLSRLVTLFKADGGRKALDTLQF